MALPWTPTLPFSEMKQWAAEAETRGVQTEQRRNVMPLTEFSDDHLVRIMREVASDTKPAYWLDFELCQIPSRAWYEWHWQRGIDPDARRSAIPTYIREAVIARDGNTCQLCGGEVAAGDVHLDHIKPWSKGGEHSIRNLQVAHSTCNMRKAARWEPEQEDD